MLMTVQGVGAKVSLAILGALGTEGVARAIALGDVAAFRAAKGIGPKTAQRVVIELKDKAPSLMAMAGRMPAEPVATVEVIEPVADTPRPKRGAAAPVRGNAAAQAEALSALTNLGYAPGEAASAVAEAAGGDPEADTSALIRLSLKLLAPKG